MSNNKFTHGGNLIMAGFVLAIIAMSLLVYNVMQNKIEMVSDNYYEKEVSFQNQIDAEKNASAYKDSFSIASNGDQIILKLPAELSQKLDSGKVHFYAQASQSDDKYFALTRNSNGVYVINAAGWRKTAYKPRLSFSAGGNQYYRTLYLQL